MTEEKTLEEALIDNIYATAYEDIDERSIERAKQRIADAVGVISIGHTAPDTDMLVKTFIEEGGKEESTVATYGAKLPMDMAAFLNALLMRSYDFEAIDAESLEEGGTTTAAHISGTTIPAALAVAEAEGASGKELLRALVLGDDITARALNASKFTVHDNFDGNGTANMLGAAVAAGLLMGLDKEQMKAAIGIAVNEMSGSMQTVFEKTAIFKFPIAASAKNGIFAAKLAKMGYTDCLDKPIDGPRGFFELYYSAPEPSMMLDHLGEKYVADCVIKPWPSCRATHPSIDAALNAIEGQDINVDDIKSVEVHVPAGTKSFVGQGFEFGMDKSYQGAFSIDFLVATAILRGDVKPDFFTPEMMTDPKLGELLAKVEIIGDLSAEYGGFGCEIVITMNDGSQLEYLCTYPLGDIYRSPMTQEQFEGKYFNNIAFGQSIDEENAKAVLQMIYDLDEVDDISEIMKLIA